MSDAPCCMASAHDQACDCHARRSILDRLLALAPHLWPSVSHRAEWDQLLRDIKAEMEGGGDGQSATH